MGEVNIGSGEGGEHPNEELMMTLEEALRDAADFLDRKSNAQFTSTVPKNAPEGSISDLAKIRTDAEYATRELKVERELIERRKTDFSEEHPYQKEMNEDIAKIDQLLSVIEGTEA